MSFVAKQEVYDHITQGCLDLYARQQVLPVDRALMYLMDLSDVPMHAPYHHYIMPAALLTLAAVAQGRDEGQLRTWLSAAEERAKLVPPGSCGNCGNCGSAVGAGIFYSVYTDAAPVKRDNWALSNEMTARCLLAIAHCPGSRCCKRTQFLAAQAACDFLHAHTDLPLAVSDTIRCHYHSHNPDCLEGECPLDGEVAQ